MEIHRLPAHTPPDLLTTCRRTGSATDRFLGPMGTSLASRMLLERARKTVEAELDPRLTPCLPSRTRIISWKCSVGLEMASGSVGGGCRATELTRLREPEVIAS